MLPVVKGLILQDLWNLILNSEWLSIHINFQAKFFSITPSLPQSMIYQTKETFPEEERRLPSTRKHPSLCLGNRMSQWFNEHKVIPQLLYLLIHFKFKSKTTNLFTFNASSCERSYSSGSMKPDLEFWLAFDFYPFQCEILFNNS